MKVVLITMVGLSTALSFVHGSAAGPAKPEATGLTPQQAQAVVMKLAAPFVDLHGLAIKAAADLGIAEASSILDQHLANTPDNADDDADVDADEDDDEVAVSGKASKKTGFSAKGVKKFQAASAAAVANGIPLLTMQDAIDCSDVCIANQGELPASMADPAETDENMDDDPAAPASGAPGTPGGAGDTEEDGGEEEDAEDGTEGDDQDDNDASSGFVNRLWKKAKRAIVPAPAAKKAPTTTPTETNDADDDDESDDTDSAPAPNTNAKPKPAPGAAQDNFAAPATGQKKVLSESELHAKVSSCAKTCMLNRAKEITPEDMDERRAQMEALLQKQEL